METTKVKLTNRDLRGMFGALQILGNRHLPTIDADLKVGRLIRLLAPLAEPIGPARQRIAARLAEADAGHGDVEKLSPLGQQLLGAAIAGAQADFDGQEVEVDLPPWRITKADLPKEKTGDDGWRNGSQLGAIIADLGLLFEPPDEKEG